MKNCYSCGQRITIDNLFPYVRIFSNGEPEYFCSLCVRLNTGMTKKQFAHELLNIRAASTEKACYNLGEIEWSKLECLHCKKRIAKNPVRYGYMTFCNTKHEFKWLLNQHRASQKADKLVKCTACGKWLCGNKIPWIGARDQPQAFCSDACMSRGY